MRALLQEMITLETRDWKPPPVNQLREEIDRLFEADGLCPQAFSNRLGQVLILLRFILLAGL